MSHQPDQGCPCNTTLRGSQAHPKNANQGHMRHREEEERSHGPVGPFDPQILNRKGSLFLTRPSGSHYMATREELLWRSGELFRWIKDEELKVRIDKTFPLSAAAEAHRYMEGRQSRGKVLLIP
jgi:NADPH:quinone reductase-like Zn-dependent oxidoreductase